MTPMKTSRLLITLLAIILCAFATDVAFAKGMKKPKPTPVPEKSSAHSTIVSVSNTDISVKAGHDTKQFKITNYTTVTLDDHRVGVGALKAGMYADVTPGGIDPGVAMSIAAKTPSGH